MDDRERKYEISVLDLPQFQGGRGWGGGTYNQFTSASEAIVLLTNPEPLPLLLCADGLYVPREPGTFPLKLPLCGEGGVWGLICRPYDSLLPGAGDTPDILGPLVIAPVRGPLKPDAVLCGAPGRLPPPMAGDELLDGGSEAGVGEFSPSDESLKVGIGGGT